MASSLCFNFLLVLVALTNVNALQEQEIDAGPSDIAAELKSLQKNITDIWNYIYDLRNAMSQHLVHLRTHQTEIEGVIHEMTHHGGPDDHHSHGMDDHHSHGTDDHHSHGPGPAPDSGASHSHMDSHGHGSSHEHGHGHDHGHSHDHGHGHDHHDDHGHGHGHSDDHHHHPDHHNHEESTDSHSNHEGHEQGQGEEHHDHHHGHSDENHHNHGDENHHSHGDSVDEKKHDTIESQQKQEDIAEKVVVATNVARHDDHDHGHDHHHHHSHGSDPLNLFGHNRMLHGRSHSHSVNTTSFPRASEANLFNFAICDVKSNTGIAPELQQDVRGQVSLWQNKQGGPLGIHVRLSGFKMDSHGQHHQQQQQQHNHHHGPEMGNDAQDTEVDSSSGHRHGMHIHENGDLSNSCQSTGAHFNPKGVNHGSPKSSTRHVGDLGNIECDEHGYTNIIFSDDIVSLTGPYSVIGKSLVIHANEDDYGTNVDDPESLKTGNAGTRIACCIIQRVDRLPVRSYKSIKLAKQHKN